MDRSLALAASMLAVCSILGYGVRGVVRANCTDVALLKELVSGSLQRTTSDLGPKFDTRVAAVYSYQRAEYLESASRLQALCAKSKCQRTDRYWLALDLARLGRFEEAGREIAAGQVEVAIAEEAGQAEDLGEIEWAGRLARSLAVTGRLPSNVEGHVWRLYEEGLEARASQFVTLFEVHYEERSPERAFLAGLRCRVERRLPDAARNFETALQRSLEGTGLWKRAWYRLWNTYRDMGAYHRAIDLLSQEFSRLSSEQASSEAAEAALAIARVYRASGEREPAKKWAEVARSLHPDWWPAYLELGLADCSVELLDRGLALNPDSPELLRAKALCLWKKDRQSEAIELGELIVARYPTVPASRAVYAALERWYLDRGNTAAAERIRRKRGEVGKKPAIPRARK